MPLEREKDWKHNEQDGLHLSTAIPDKITDVCYEQHHVNWDTASEDSDNETE